MSGNGFTESGRTDLWGIFCYMDTDKSGTLDKKEFKRFILCLGSYMQKSNVKKLIKDSTGGLKKLDFETFLNVLWYNYFEGASPKEYETIFHQIVGQWGLGTPPNIHPNFTNDQSEQLAQVFTYLDRDGSGYLDKNELTKLVKACGQLGNKQATQSAMGAIKNLKGFELDYMDFLDFFWNNYGAFYVADWDSYQNLIDWVEHQITGGNYFGTEY